MLFGNRKFRNIFAFAYYGAFILAAVIVVAVGAATGREMAISSGDDPADGAGFFGAFIFLLLVGVAVFLHLAYDVFIEKPFLRTVFMIIGYVVVLLFTPLCCLGCSASGISDATLRMGYAALIYNLVTIYAYNIDDEEDVIYTNIINIVRYAMPFVAYLIFWLLSIFFTPQILLVLIFSAYVALGIHIAVQEVCFETILNYIYFGATALIALLLSLIFGINNSDYGFNFKSTPTDCLVFTPILMLIGSIVLKVSEKISDLDKVPVYYAVSRIACALGIAFIQVFIGYIWWAGLLTFAAVLAALWLVDHFLGDNKYRRSSYSSSSSTSGRSSSSSNSDDNIATVCNNLRGRSGKLNDHYYYRVNNVSYSGKFITVYITFEHQWNAGWDNNPDSSDFDGFNKIESDIEYYDLNGYHVKFVRSVR